MLELVRQRVDLVLKVMKGMEETVLTSTSVPVPIPAMKATSVRTVSLVISVPHVLTASEGMPRQELVWKMLRIPNKSVRRSTSVRKALAAVIQIHSVSTQTEVSYVARVILVSLGMDTRAVILVTCAPMVPILATRMHSVPKLVRDDSNAGVKTGMAVTERNVELILISMEFRQLG